MLKAYEIIYSVLEAYSGLPGKLARMTGKTDTWHRSHGYEPRTSNPLSNGNKSAVDDYMAFCERYEAVERGSGRMLSSRVFAELDSRFAENDFTEDSQRDLHVGIETETCDVRKWLASFDVENASRNDLMNFEQQCDEAVEAIYKAKGRARVIRMSVVAFKGKTA